MEFARHPLDASLVEAKIAAFDGFWQGRTIAVMLRHTVLLGVRIDPL
jgi:hypothetical protein